MRTKEALDRQSQEDQERAWIYMLHNQAPPLTRRPLAAGPADAHTPSGFIPLAPLAAHAPSPLAAARAVAASLHMNASSNATAASATWPAASQPSSLACDARASFSGMVKLEKAAHSSTASSSQKSPLLGPSPSSSTSAGFVFRSGIPTPGVPEAPTPSAHVLRTPGSTMNGVLVGMLPKRAREEEFVNESAQNREHQDYEYESGDETSARANNGNKRACLPKKCDFPMCKNSSRSRGFCYSHGGGRRCRVDGCANGAVSRDLCKRHGGGRRCRIQGCKSSSESGGLCYSHGGGRRCNLSWCNARAKKGGYCAAHVDNRNAPPPVDVAEIEQHDNDVDRAALVAKAPVRIAAKTLSAADAAVNPQVVETLLMLSKSPSQSEAEDNSDASTTPSGADLLSPRLSNPYAIASILN